MIGSPGQVVVKKAGHLRRIEEAGGTNTVRRKSLDGQRPQRAPEPGVERDAETLLAPINDRVGDSPAHQPLQQVLPRHIP